MAFAVTTKQLLYDWLIDLLNTPYVWGGQEAVDGNARFDCSGLMVEGLRRFGVIPANKDMSAQGLYDYFKKYEVTGGVQLGDLIFYGSSKGNIGHVMMGINDQMCVGAQGGGQNTKSVADAVSGDGYVRPMVIDYRDDRVAVVRPPWPLTKAEVTSGA